MENENQLSLALNYGNEITNIYNLKRSKKPIVSKVLVDECTQEASKNFDYSFNGTNEFYPFEFPKMLEELDFNILCIVGASGSGKSIFSKNFGEIVEPKWDNSKAIISNFENVDEAIERLNSVGLNSIPTWCKPRNVLSIGEGFRADLARQICNNCVIDEYTSVVDRNVALSCSNSIQKYIRKKGFKKCVFVSCHKDFIDTLKPDYVIDLDDECIYDTRRLPKRNFELSIYETTAKEYIWHIFRHHHYLSKEINYASRIYLGYFNDELVSMMAILPLPNGYLKNAYRIHRLVVLPDYQGLGIGTKLIEYFANLHKKMNCGFYIRTSHVKLHNYFKNNNNWIETGRSGKKSPSNKLWYMNDERTPYSYKYVGEYNEKLDKNNIFLYQLQKEIKEDMEYQMSLFDIVE